MITMRRNLGSILIMTTTISSITMHMKKEQGKVLFDNQINNGSIGIIVNLGRDGRRLKMRGSEGTILLIDEKEGKGCNSSYRMWQSHEW